MKKQEKFKPVLKHNQYANYVQDPINYISTLVEKINILCDA